MATIQRVAIVTGGSRGIGRAIACRLAADGHRVVVDYRSEATAATEVVEAIAAAGGEARAVRADVAVAGDVRQLVESTLAAWGRVDILVNNAGIARDGLMLRMDDEAWNQVIGADLTGVFLCMRACLKPMVRARWGRIVTVGSVAGLTGNPGQTNYAAAKAGVVGLTASVAKEVASRGITANVVAPGLIATDLTSGLDERARQRIEASIPMGRVGRPEEVADLVSFLVSDRAGYITAEVIRVDGGLAAGA